MRQKRAELAARAAGTLIKSGFPTFSPIAHGHFICQESGVGGDWKTWSALDSALLMSQNCCCFIGLLLPGYVVSEGWGKELVLSLKRPIPAFYMSVHEIVHGLSHDFIVKLNNAFGRERTAA